MDPNITTNPNKNNHGGNASSNQFNYKNESHYINFGENFLSNNNNTIMINENEVSMNNNNTRNSYNVSINKHDVTEHNYNNSNKLFSNTITDTDVFAEEFFRLSNIDNSNQNNNQNNLEKSPRSNSNKTYPIYQVGIIHSEPCQTEHSNKYYSNKEETPLLNKNKRNKNIIDPLNHEQIHSSCPNKINKIYNQSLKPFNYIIKYDFLTPKLRKFKLPNETRFKMVHPKTQETISINNYNNEIYKSFEHCINKEENIYHNFISNFENYPFSEVEIPRKHTIKNQQQIKTSINKTVLKNNDDIRDRYMSNFIKISSDKKQLTKFRKLQNRLPIIMEETPKTMFTEHNIPHQLKTQADKWPPPFKHYSHAMPN